MKSNQTRCSPRVSSSFILHPSAFTLVELLVVIGIIVILISLLIPAVGRIRTSAKTAETRANINQLSAAIEVYNNDFHAYPGPLSNNEVGNISGGTGVAPCPPIYLSTTEGSAITTAGFFYTEPKLQQQVTMSENLVLGLMGGLKYDTTNNTIVYDPRLVGNGPTTILNAGLNKHYSPYISDQKHLSWRTETGLKTGHFTDDAGAANDTIIPEFVDTYADPLPILYLRAKKGAAINPTFPYDYNNNTVITYASAELYGTPPYRIGQYDLHQVIGYTSTTIGTGRKAPTYVGWGAATPSHGLSDEGSPNLDINETTTNRYPMGAYAYFRNQSLSSPSESDTAKYTTVATNPRNDVPFQKDGFILISAGPDRVFGTKDDVTNFGAVGQ